MKRLLTLFFLLAFVCLLAMLPLKAEAKAETMTTEQIEAYLEADGLEYYAYMILEDALRRINSTIKNDSRTVLCAGAVCYLLNFFFRAETVEVIFSSL